MANKIKEIGFNKKTRSYTMLLDEERQIYGVMPCLGCYPSRRPCMLHDKEDYEAGKPTLMERLRANK